MTKSNLNPSTATKDVDIRPETVSSYRPDCIQYSGNISNIEILTFAIKGI